MRHAVFGLHPCMLLLVELIDCCMLYLCCTCVCARPTVQAVAACSRCMPDGCSYGRLGCRALALHECRSGSLQPEGQCARHACGSGRRSPCHYICCHAHVVINKQWAICEINRSLVQRSLVQRSRHTTAASSFVIETCCVWSASVHAAFG